MPLIISPASPLIQLLGRSLMMQYGGVDITVSRRGHVIGDEFDYEVM